MSSYYYTGYETYGWGSPANEQPDDKKRVIHYWSRPGDNATTVRSLCGRRLSTKVSFRDWWYSGQRKPCKICLGKLKLEADRGVSTLRVFEDMKRRKKLAL